MAAPPNPVALLLPVGPPGLVVALHPAPAAIPAGIATPAPRTSATLAAGVDPLPPPAAAASALQLCGRAT
jgi:hypothetical protein